MNLRPTDKQMEAKGEGGRPLENPDLKFLLPNMPEIFGLGFKEKEEGAFSGLTASVVNCQNLIVCIRSCMQEVTGECFSIRNLFLTILTSD